MRLFCQAELAKYGWQGTVAQINHTFTRNKGSIRGLHFQYPPFAETKLVMCLKGEVIDVAVDLRTGASTLLKHVAVTLSEGNNLALLIPPGFAHGFQTITDNVEMLYLHSQPYEPTSEGGLNALDEKIGIDWPQPLGDMSERDRNLPFAANFMGIEL